MAVTAPPTRILAIDPGPTETAWLFLQGGRPQTFGTSPNGGLLDAIRYDGVASLREGVSAAAIETIEPRYGVLMGRETIDTAIWIGRFLEALWPLKVELLRRSEVLRHFGVVTSPKKGETRVSADSGVRQALIDRFGGGKAAAVGVKAAPGPLYGISGDAWSALAVGVTFADRLEGREA